MHTGDTVNGGAINNRAGTAGIINQDAGAPYPQYIFQLKANS